MRLRWAAGWWVRALYAFAAAAVLGLAPEAALAKAAGKALSYPSNSLNYPPIGAGIETMASQGGSGYAIVLGNNCTPEILNCTTYTFPYEGGPVQLVILGRTTLTPLFAQTFSGSAGEAVLAATKIGALAANEPIVVILAALLTGDTTQIDPSWFNVIGMIVPEPGVSLFNNSLITNVGGWSAIGIPAGSGTPRPVGHINTGSGDWSGVQYPVGDLRGYFQKQPGGPSWFFTTGGFAAFNTSASRTATGNTMQINGTAYPSGPLIAANGASCAAGGAGGGPGGFQLVVLNASTLNPLPPASNTPVNQTFATNCGAEDTDVAGIDALAGALVTVLLGQKTSASGGGALVFLQSIGAPIVPTPFAPQQEQAAGAISPLVELLGGVADAFNKSWWFASAAPGNPGYALAGSTALLGDAPSGAQIGVYASEASSAAPGSTAPVLLDGLLRRNYLGRYVPVSAAATQGSEPAFLPVTVYQPIQAWPHSGEASELSKTLLTWFSETLGIQYTSSSSCYMPSYPNVRAEYCDTNPIPGAGEGWGHVASTLLRLTFPGTSICQCSSADAECVAECPAAWAALQAQLAKEMNWVGYIQSGLTTGGNSLRDVLTDSENNSYIDLEQAADQVLDAVDMAGSSAAVAGFWVTLASNALKFAKNFASSDGLGPVLGIFSTIGPLGENLASVDSNTTLGQIQTTAQALPSELSSRFIAAANQLGLFQSIVASDYGKLAALGENPVFQSNPFTDATWQTQVVNGVSLFAYGRLLGAAYYAWGLLPDSYNPGYPDNPADYFCGNVGSDGAYPFGNNGPGSADLTWTGFTYPNFLAPLRVYGGSPNLLALGSQTPDIFSIYSTVPTSVMQAVVAGSGQPPSGGLADWDVWFFRHNFTQAGFKCSDLNPPRHPPALRGKASKVGGPGDAGLVFIDATVTGAGPIDLSAARLVVSQVLMEADRAGELVRTAAGSPFLPLELTAARGSRPNRATFKTPAGARPIVSVEVTNRDVKTGRLALSLTVNRARLPQTAQACETGGTALLRTRIELDDRIHPPVIFSVERPWTCNRSRLATP